MINYVQSGAMFIVAEKVLVNKIDDTDGKLRSFASCNGKIILKTYDSMLVHFKIPDYDILFDIYFCFAVIFLPFLIIYFSPQNSSRDVAA